MRYYIFIITLLFILNSCAPPLYIPNTTNTPTLEKKGDIEASAALGTSGFDVQLAGAVTDDIGIMINGSHGSYNSDSSTNTREHSFGEIGVGYTVLLSSDNKYSTPFFTLFSGMGIGNSTQEYNILNDIDNVNGNYHRYFIQPTIGINGEFLEFMFSYRVTYVNFYQFNASFNTDGLRNSNTFYEPSITLKLGNEDLKFFGQFGFALNQKTNDLILFRQRPIMLSLGVSFDFEIFKKEEDQSPFF